MMRRLLPLLVLLGLVVSVAAQGVAFTGVAQVATNLTGQGLVYAPISAAKVYVCAGVYTGTACTASNAITVYSNASLTNALSPPLTADQYGNFSFFAAPGAYFDTVSGGISAPASYQISMPVSNPVYAASPNITPTSIEGTLYADQFTGADMNAKVNAAIAALSGGCGTVVIPAGTYSVATQIVKPRCVILTGQGVNATILSYTPTSGAAVAIGDSTGSTQYAGSGIRDLWIKGPGGALGAGAGTSIGLWLGGDPANVVLPSGDYADLQQFNHVKISGFATGVEWASNAWLDTFWGSEVLGNQVGITEASGTSNSVEQNSFVAGAIFNNAIAFDSLTIDLNLVNASIDYNCNGTSATILNSSFRAENVHFEQSCGPFIANTSPENIWIHLGEISYTNPSQSLSWLIEQGGANPFLSISGTLIFADSAISELVDYTGSGTDQWMDVRDLSGNGNQDIASLFQSGFSPPANAHVAAWTPGWSATASQGLASTFVQGATADPGPVCAAQLTIHDTATDSAPNKYVRLFGNPGSLQIVNSACSAVIWSLDDSGDVGLSGGVTAGPSGLTASGSTSGATTFKAPATGGGTITAPQGNGTIAVTSQLPLSGSVAGSTTLLAANSCGDTVTVTITGATTSMVAKANSSAAFPGTSNGLIVEAAVTSANTVSIGYCNVTGSGITPSAATIQVRVVQ